MSNSDIDNIKNKLRFFGQKSAEKIKEIKHKIDEHFTEDTESESTAPQSPTGRKQPKNSFDRLLDKIPKVSIVIEKKSNDEEEDSLREKSDTPTTEQSPSPNNEKTEG